MRWPYKCLQDNQKVNTINNSSCNYAKAGPSVRPFKCNPLHMHYKPLYKIEQSLVCGIYWCPHIHSIIHSISSLLYWIRCALSPNKLIYDLGVMLQTILALSLYTIPKAISFGDHSNTLPFGSSLYRVVSPVQMITYLVSSNNSHVLTSITQKY